MHAVLAGLIRTALAGLILAVYAVDDLNSDSHMHMNLLAIRVIQGNDAVHYLYRLCAYPA